MPVSCRAKAVYRHCCMFLGYIITKILICIDLFEVGQIFYFSGFDTFVLKSYFCCPEET